MMNILITGGAGFIGSNLVEYHLAKGDSVYVIDDLSSGKLENISSYLTNPNFHFEKANLLTTPRLDEAVKWSDRIYHFAAVIGIFRVLAEPVNVVETNIQGSERLFRSVLECGGNKRIVFASSSCVYGEATYLKEDSDLIINQVANPLLGYGISKLAVEIIAKAYFKAHQMPITLIRFFNVIGPKQTGFYGMVVPRFIKQACNNEPMTIFGGGTQTRSFCDVRDAIEMVNLLVSKEESIGEVFNVGADSEISINALAELVKQRTGSSSEFKYVPYEEAYGADFSDTQQRRPILDKLHSLVDFKHQWTLEKSIDDLISRYRSGPR